MGKNYRKFEELIDKAKSIIGSGLIVDNIGKLYNTVQ